MKRIDRIMDAAIWATIGAILALLIRGCVPGGAAASSPAQTALAGLEIEMGGCGVTQAKSPTPWRGATSMRQGASCRSRCNPGQPPMNIAPAVESGPPRARDGTAAIGSVSDAGGGLIAANRTGRAADKQDVPSTASAMRLPRGADAKLAQARLVCSFPPVRRALDMLRMHESADGTQMVGDGGKAQGWLQQHQDHWQVGCEVLGVSWPWPADTRDLAKCELVAVGNWMRYAPKYLAAGNIEELVRRFRLPSKPYRVDNDAYWARVKESGA